MSETAGIEKEADHHPYFRPKDAATLILIDRSGPVPKVLVGKRHDKVVFMPGKFVFPGGRVDKSDNRVPGARTDPESAGSQSAEGTSEDRSLARACAGGCRDPRGLRGNRALSRPQEQRGDTGRRVETFFRCRPAARPLQPVPDCARDHPARPRAAFRYKVF